MKAAVVLALLLALFPQEEKVARVTQQEFKRLIAARQVTIVDVRDEVSFRNAHIPGAVLMPFEDVREWTPAMEQLAVRLRRGPKILVAYCA